MGVITYNGIASTVYDIHVETPPEYTMAEKDYEVIHIPGKSGDLFIDKGSYKNVERSYVISVGAVDGNYAKMANNISKWLHSAVGYARLEDSYEPDYYRMAVYEEENSIENILGQAGRTTVSFNCKPQRFLKSGENTTTFQATGTLTNPTVFDALPIITVHGSGSGVLQVGDYVVTLSDIGTYLTINCEIQDVYKDTLNKNSAVTLSDGFPKLHAGSTEISFSGGITSVEVVPNWWTI